MHILLLNISKILPLCHVSSTRLTHELVSLFALATAPKLYFLTTEYLFEAGIDTSVFAWHSTQSDAVSDSNDVDIQPILTF